jgi:hypothetical protein
MRRPSTWKIAALVAAASVSAVAGLGLWVHFRIQAEWEAVVRQVDETLDRVNSRPSRRAAGALPGNGWDDYLKAAPAVAALSRKSLLEETDPAGSTHPLSLLLQGTRRATARYPFPEIRRRDYLLPPALQNTASGVLAVGNPSAKVLFDKGKRREAIDLLLDESIFGLDLWDRGFETDVLDGQGVVRQCFVDLEAMIVSRTLGKDDLLHLLGRLQHLDSSWPDHEIALQNDLLDLGMLLIREDRDEEIRLRFSDHERVRREWRTLYSSRFLAVRQFRNAEAILRRVSDTQKLPIEIAHPTIFRIHQEAQASPDPLMSTFYHVLYGTSSRTMRAQGRLMQMAARYLTTGELVELSDPMGGKLQAAAAGERVVFRRIGVISDAAPPPSGPEDIVVETERK